MAQPARTLVISDLHLGSRLGRDVLRLPAPRAALLGALEEVDRLVLLGDTLELLEGRPRRALELARPVLRRLGRAVPEIVLVAGNHDHALVRPWVRTRLRERRPIGRAARVPVRDAPLLEAVVDALRPARVRVQYPGTWLAPDVYAMHGHYVDVHLAPALPGLGPRTRLGRWLGALPPGRATTEDYERAGGFTVAALQSIAARELPAPLGTAVDAAAGAARRTGFAALPVLERTPGSAALAPLTAGVLGHQLRRAGLAAASRVAEDLGVRARHVVFGHVHRTGPLVDDVRDEWVPDRGPALLNSGSWVFEPLLLAGARPPHPYWPGGAVRVERGRPPRTVTLLDDVPVAALRPA